MRDYELAIQKDYENQLKKLRAELAAANEIIDRLAKTERKVADAIGDAYLLDLPDGGDVKLWEGVERLRADLAAERERADKAKATEHKQWVRALLRVLPEERAVLFREICLARAALGGGDE